MKQLAMLTLLSAATIGCVDPLGELNSSAEATGVWAGSASFTDSSANPRCQWNGGLVPPSVTIDFDEMVVSIQIDGSGIVDLDAGDGFDCLRLWGSAGIENMTTSSTRVTFRDKFGAEPGNLWDLTLTSSTMDGNVTNTEALPGTGLRTVSSLSLGRQ